MDIRIVLLTCVMGHATATFLPLKLHKLGLLHGGYAPLFETYTPVIHPIGFGPSGFNHGFVSHGLNSGYGPVGFGGNINPNFGYPGFGGNFAAASASAGSFNGINPGFGNNVAFASAQSGSGGFGNSNAVATAQAGSGYSGGNAWPSQYAPVAPPVNSYGTPIYR